MVQYRAQGFVVWGGVIDNQVFFEGDNLATGSNSNAKVMLFDGRILEVGPNSQISISNDFSRLSDNYEYSVTLLKGTVVAKLSSKEKRSSKILRNLKTAFDKVVETKKQLAQPLTLAKRITEAITPTPPPPPQQKTEQTAQEVAEEPPPASSLVIKAGEQTFSLNQENSEIALKKNIETPAPEVQNVKGDVDFKAEEAATTSVKLEIKEEIIVNDYKPVLAGVSENTILWAPVSLRKTRQKLTVPIELKVAPDIKIQKGVVGFLAMHDPDNELIKRFNWTPKTHNEVIHVELNSALDAAEDEAKENNEYTIQLTPGSRRQNDHGANLGEYIGTPSSLRIRSLRDIGSGSINVRVSLKSGKPDLDQMWLLQKVPFPKMVASTNIYLPSGDDLSKVEPIIRRKDYFAISPTREKMPASGVFIVKDKEIVTHLSAYNEAIVKELLRQFGARFAFKGRKIALVTGNIASGDIEKNTAHFKQWIFLTPNNRFIQVNKSFLPFDQARELMQQDGTLLFSEPVTILDVKK